MFGAGAVITLLGCVAGAPAASAAGTNPCGNSTAPSGWAAAGTWSELSTDVSTDGDAQVYLTASIDESVDQDLAVISGESLTLDLCGENLTITDVPAGDAAVEVPSSSSLTIEDTSSSDVRDQGTLSATGAAGGFNQGGGAGIGGSGGPENQAGDAGGSIAVISGNVVATGGTAGPNGGSGAGIGGGGGGGVNVITQGAGGDGGSVSVSGGTVTATGGESENGAGAGIGGAGGGDSGGRGHAGVGGDGGSVSMSSGTISSTGGESDFEGGGGSGIGGGGGGYNAGSGAGASVSLSGGTATVSGGISAQQAAGAGIGYGGYGENGSNGGAGTVEITGGAAAGLSGEVVSELTVDSGAMLDVPANDTVTLDGAGTSTNDGTIAVAGTFTGDTSLANHGTIAVAGSNWSGGTIVADEVSGGPGLNITDNAYELTFDAGAGTSTAPALWVFAPTVADSGQSMPTSTPPPGQAFSGWSPSAGVQVTSSSSLTGLGAGPLMDPLTAKYVPDTTGTTSTGTTTTTTGTTTSTGPVLVSKVNATARVITWCWGKGKCAYPKTYLRFSLSRAAVVRLVLDRRHDGRWTEVAKTTIKGHRGANSKRLAGRWHGYLVPAGKVRLLVQTKRANGWKTVKAMSLTVRHEHRS